MRVRNLRRFFRFLIYVDVDLFSGFAAVEGMDSVLGSNAQYCRSFIDLIAVMNVAFRALESKIEYATCFAEPAVFLFINVETGRPPPRPEPLPFYLRRPSLPMRFRYRSTSLIRK